MLALLLLLLQFTPEGGVEGPGRLLRNDNGADPCHEAGCRDIREERAVRSWEPNAPAGAPANGDEGAATNSSLSVSSTPVIIAIVVGVLVFIAIVVAVICYLLRRKRREMEEGGGRGRTTSDSLPLEAFLPQNVIVRDSE